MHWVEVQFDTMANYYMSKEGSAGLDFDQSNEEAIESPYDVSEGNFEEAIDVREGSVSLDFDKKTSWRKLSRKSLRH